MQLYHLCAVTLLFTAWVEPLHGLRVYSHVYKAKDKQSARGDVILQAIERLEQMWPSHSGMTSKQMLSQAVFDDPSFDPTVLRQKLAQRMKSRQPFVFATFGSSVSAGHDNFPNQSWPFQLERILKPTFQALDFDIEVRQRAMGGYGETPFAASCMANRAGSGVDALSWEFEMFNDNECERAMFMRETTEMETKPVVFSFAESSPNFGYDHLEERIPMRDELFHHKNDAWHGEYHPDEWYFSEDFISTAEAKKYYSESSKLRETPPFIGREIFFQQYQNVRIAKENNVRGFYAVHPAAIGNAFFTQDPWYSAREKAFKINWHPGPLGHSLLASIVAHKMLTALRQEFEGISFTAVSAGPTPNNPLVGNSAKALDSRCGKLNSQTCTTGVTPSSQPLSAWRNIRSSGSHDKWQFVRVNLDDAEQIDRRYVWRGVPDSGELKFDVDVPASGDQYVLVCQTPCGWSCEEGAGFISAKNQRWWNEDVPSFQKGIPRKEVSDLEFSVDGNKVAPSTLLSLHDELFHVQHGSYCPGCVNTADVCQPAGKLSPGKHTIGLQVKPSSYMHPKMHVDVLEVVLVG